MPENMIKRVKHIHAFLLKSDSSQQCHEVLAIGFESRFNVNCLEKKLIWSIS
jgi:hypothetical protein